MTTKTLVPLETLGLCEHCSTLLTIQHLSGDSMDAEWRCPSCRGILSGASFGYEGEGQETKKIKWVGPEEKWVTVKPTEDFDLGDWSILAVPLPIISHFY